MKKIISLTFLLILCFAIKSTAISPTFLEIISTPQESGVSGCVSAVGAKTDTGGSEGSSTGFFCGKWTQSGTCTVNTARMYAKYVSGGANVKLGLYDDVGGTPTNLIAGTSAIASGAAYAWVGSANNLGDDFTLTDGTSYWGCFVADASVYYMYDTVGSTLSWQCSTDTCDYAGSMYSTMQGGSTYTRAIAIKFTDE